jgi:hypothetical protein
VYEGSYGKRARITVMSHGAAVGTRGGPFTTEDAAEAQGRDVLKNDWIGWRLE